MDGEILFSAVVVVNLSPCSKAPKDASKQITVVSITATINKVKILQASEFVFDFDDYAGLENDKYHALAEKYLPNGTCGVVSFGVKGGRKAAEEFMKKLKLIAIETHVADARSCCLHPASATHRQMNDEELIACGITNNLVRLSCGLESAEDLIADIAQALN